MNGMSIIIKGMEMPESCTLCQLRQPGAGGDPDWCKALNCVIFPKEGRIEKDCPLIELPTHGRLIDADAIPYKKIMLDEDDDEFYYGVTQPYIDRMPTIIPAEEGET